MAAHKKKTEKKIHSTVHKSKKAVKPAPSTQEKESKTPTEEPSLAQSLAAPVLQEVPQKEELVVASEINPLPQSPGAQPPAPKETPVPTQEPSYTKLDEAEQAVPTDAANGEAPAAQANAPQGGTPEGTSEVQGEQPLVASQTPSVSSEPTTPDNGQASHSNRLILLVIVTAVLFAVVIAGGLFYYMTFMSPSSQQREKQVTTVAPTKAPASPTPEAVDLSNYTIEVLNGSGIAGAAKRTGDDLEGKGFVIDSVGNAQSLSPTTIIKTKKDVSQAFVTELLAAVPDAELATKSADVVPESSDVDVIIILGKNQ